MDHLMADNIKNNKDSQMGQVTPKKKYLKKEVNNFIFLQDDYFKKLIKFGNIIYNKKDAFRARLFLGIIRLVLRLKSIY